MNRIPPSFVVSLLVWMFGTSTANADDPLAVRSFLENHCIGCHGKDLQKGKFRADTLPSDFRSPEAMQNWSRVVARVDAGEMPPPKRTPPPVAEVTQAMSWIKSGLADEARRTRQADGRTRMRRLNRTEYEYTIHDLLGIDIPLKAMLPEDGTRDGFDTAEAGLSVSPIHIQRYLAAAEAAMDRAITHRLEPLTVKKQFSFADASQNDYLRHPNNSPILRSPGGKLQIFSETHPEVFAGLRAMSQLTRDTPGRYRVRITVSTFDRATPHVPFSIRINRVAPNLIGYFDASPGTPQTIEFVHDFGPNETFGVYPYRLGYTRQERGLGYMGSLKVGEVGPALCLHGAEVEGPLHDIWPPQNHRQLMGELPLVKFNKLPGTYIPERLFSVGYVSVRESAVTVAFPTDPAGHARRLLADFLPRAFRRPIDADEIPPYLQMVTDRLKQKYCFEEAMNVAYRAALCSPDFLFLTESPGPLSPHALANRLSYFLWRSMPDETLFKLAQRGDLKRPEILRGQVERMLKDPKANRFIHDFCDQWLRLNQLDATVPDKNLYPEFFESTIVDGMLREAIVAETRLFIAEMIRENHSISSIVDSDFTYLNERLAQFYGIPDISGTAMRRVALTPANHRGGLLTHASIHKVTANGTATSPVLRGKWVLENILGRPPSPPPADAGTIEPDTRGAKTIREQLAKHQRLDSCATCHRHIDPLGFALEAYDPVGQYREHYRSTQIGTPVKATFNGGEAVKYRSGPPVEVAGQLADGRSFQSLPDLKRLIGSRPDLIAHCLARKMLTFATGHSVEIADSLTIEGVIARSRPSRLGMRSLIHEIVQTDLFLNK